MNKHINSTPGKTRRLAAPAALLAAGCLLAITPDLRAHGYNNVNPGPPGGTSGWTQDFFDDFNGSSLDTNKWNTTWMGSHWWKQPSDGGITYYNDGNLVVGNGMLKIVTKRESISGSQFTSGIVTTQNKYTFGPGTYLEARVKAPKGKGLWSSFWTRSAGDVYDWPPEIDMFELWNTDWTCGVPQTWHSRDGSGTETQNQFTTWADDSKWPWHYDTWGSGWFGDYHVFAADWETDHIDFYIDGVKTATTSNNVSAYSNRKQFLILQIIGDGGWAPPMDSTTPLPAEYCIDWVRAWKKNGTGTTSSAYGFYSETAPNSFAGAGGSIGSYDFSVSDQTSGAPEGSHYLKLTPTGDYADYRWQYPASGANVSSAWSGKSLKFKACANTGGFEVALCSKDGTRTAVNLDSKVPSNGTWTDVSIPISSFNGVNLNSVSYLEFYRAWNSSTASLVLQLQMRVAGAAAFSPPPMTGSRHGLVSAAPA